MGVGGEEWQAQAQLQQHAQRGARQDVLQLRVLQRQGEGAETGCLCWS